MKELDLSKKIIQLEIHSASQDELLGDLNLAVLTMQKKIERLEKQFKTLQAQTASGDLVKKLEDEQPPPHY